MTAPARRAGSMDDIMSMESDLIRLQGENARLRATIEEMRKKDTKTNTMNSIKPLAKAYVAARDASAKAVQDNNLSAKNHESTGTGHQTPFAVLDSVRKWQLSAMELAEKVASELGVKNER